MSTDPTVPVVSVYARVVDVAAGPLPMTGAGSTLATVAALVVGLGLVAVMCGRAVRSVAQDIDDAEAFGDDE